MSTTDTDKGHLRIRKLMKKLKSGDVVVGALDAENAQKLAYAEFGTATAPARPVVRTTMEANKSKYGRLMEDALARGVTKSADASTVLDTIGKTIASDLRQAIVKWSDPPNAASTIARKGKDNPLVDTGALVKSIVYKVNK